MTSIGFLKTLLTSVSVGIFAVLGFMLSFDPYGIAPWAKTKRPVIVDSNQRIMHPQIIRSGSFDSAIFGTSTIRLVDPDRLSNAVGGRFANLGMNAATPWEQREVFNLFLANVSAPRRIVFGIDWQWCQEGGTLPQTTFRGFPYWLYDKNLINDLVGIFSLTGAELAGRKLFNAIGLLAPRVRYDGYDVFTPDEATYDLRKARTYIWGGNGTARSLASQEPAVRLSENERLALRFPAHVFLADMVKALPAETEVIIAHMPVHQSVWPIVGTREDAVRQECKRRIVGLVAMRRSLIIDFSNASSITTNDENYWDPLHYRLPIAAQIADGISSGIKGGSSANGIYAVQSFHR